MAADDLTWKVSRYLESSRRSQPRNDVYDKAKLGTAVYVSSAPRTRFEPSTSDKLQQTPVRAPSQVLRRTENPLRRTSSWQFVATKSATLRRRLRHFVGPPRGRRRRRSRRARRLPALRVLRTTRPRWRRADDLPSCVALRRGPPPAKPANTRTLPARRRLDRKRDCLATRAPHGPAIRAPGADAAKLGQGVRPGSSSAQSIARDRRP